MIKPKHPLECTHTQQEFFLNHLVDEKKEYHTLRISYSNAVYLYYNLQLNISVHDYEEWLNEIADEKVRSAMQSKGFEECRKTFSFTRFIHKKRRIIEEDYIRQKMGDEQYNRYKALSIGAETV